MVLYLFSHKNSRHFVFDPNSLVSISFLNCNNGIGYTLEYWSVVFVCLMQRVMCTPHNKSLAWPHGIVEQAEEKMS